MVCVVPYSMLKSQRTPTCLSDAIVYLSDPDNAIRFLAELRWPDGVKCPHCGADDPGFLATRRIWKCRAKPCRKQFSIKVGTIFEDSPLGLDKWLPALWLVANAKNGISSYEVGRALHVTQKTAWFMLGRIRAAMAHAGGDPLSGAGEIDEAFLGGKVKNMRISKRRRLVPGDARGSHYRTTSPVIGALERPRGKNGVSRVHPNGIENFWSLLKRTIRGTYISVDPFHVPRYLSEQVFRCNNRRASDGERFVAVIDSLLGKRLTYRDLIGADLTPATT